MLAYLKKRSKTIWGFLQLVVKAYARHDNANKAAAMAYFSLFSIFPLLLFVVYLASFFFPSESSRVALSSFLEEVFPYGAADLYNVVDQTYKARGSIGLISGLGLLWGGSSIFSVLATSLSAIWGSAPRSYWRRRLLAVISVLALGLTFLISFFVGPLVALVQDGGVIDYPSLTYAFELIVVTMVVMLLYRIFPNRRVHWGAAFLGAFTAAVLIVLAKFGFRMYTSIVIVRSGLLYGSLAWFLTLAIWVYLISVLILFGAEFAAVFQKRQVRKKELLESEKLNATEVE